MDEPGWVVVARRGRSELTTTIQQEAQVRDLVENMLKATGRRVDMSSPFVDAMLPDDSRLHVVIPDVTRAHWSVNIRKFVLSANSLDELVRLQTLTAQAARFLEAAVVAGLNVIVAGGTQAGKTTLLNCLAGAIRGRERVITCEEVFELPSAAALRMSFGDSARKFGQNHSALCAPGLASQTTNQGKPTMLKRKLASSVLAAIVIAAALSGCGGGGVEPVSKVGVSGDAQITADAVTKAAEEAAAEAVKAAEVVAAAEAVKAAEVVAAAEAVKVAEVVAAAAAATVAKAAADAQSAAVAKAKAAAVAKAKAAATARAKAAAAAAAVAALAPVASVFYANCSDVRAAGADPIRLGEPGYSTTLDRDRDGIACE